MIPSFAPIALRKSSNTHLSAIYHHSTNAAPPSSLLYWQQELCGLLANGILNLDCNSLIRSTLNLKKSQQPLAFFYSTLTLSHYNIKKCVDTTNMGGRTYPVRYYPVAIRLRDREGRAILCSHYFLHSREKVRIEVWYQSCGTNFSTLYSFFTSLISTTSWLASSFSFSARWRRTSMAA